jgi:riboflavin kinase/FMN adenylyltransferase
MNVYRDIDHLPQFKNAVITIGTFDGVHKGHQKIISQLLEEAKAIDGTAVLISFSPHPRQVIGKPGQPIEMLNSPDEKYQLLEKYGIKHVVEVPFTLAFAEQSPQEYISSFLVKLFKPQIIIIGYDHKFGRDRKGDYHLLEQMGEQLDYNVKEIPEHVLNDITISSTRIRKALKEGDIITANDYLGYPYFFSGRVVKGNQLGRTIGFATANIELADQEKLVPGNAVYAVTAKTAGSNEVWKGMMNIGLRPTVDGSKKVIEVNIFDFDEMIYDEVITITIYARLRFEQKFDGLDALKTQLAQDKSAAIHALQNL